MQIVLMRHGRPAIESTKCLNAKDFGAWVERYEAAAIDPAYPPPATAIDQSRQAAYLMCSTLPRSLSSANALGVEAPDGHDAAFREMEMPSADWRYPVLPVAAWAVLFRLAWTLGYHRDTESFTAAKARADDCADVLARLAAAHGKVLFIGHGTLNWFIARALRRAGWRSPDKAPRHHWQSAIFSRTTPQSP
jgi:broad specificity phosphatase PhoE